MVVFNNFYHLAGGDGQSINTVMSALLPKKDIAIDLSHYRPISLIHFMGKLIAKVLSIRLAAVMQDLISPAPSVFEKAKCISVRAELR